MQLMNRLVWRLVTVSIKPCETCSSSLSFFLLGVIRGLRRPAVVAPVERAPRLPVNVFLPWRQNIYLFHHLGSVIFFFVFFLYFNFVQNFISSNRNILSIHSQIFYLLMQVCFRFHFTLLYISYILSCYYRTIYFIFHMIWTLLSTGEISVLKSTPSPFIMSRLTVTAFI